MCVLLPYANEALWEIAKRIAKGNLGFCRSASMIIWFGTITDRDVVARAVTQGRCLVGTVSLADAAMK
jgi:hypothetical protein